MPLSDALKTALHERFARQLARHDRDEVDASRRIVVDTNVLMDLFYLISIDFI